MKREKQMTLCKQIKDELRRRGLTMQAMALHIGMSPGQLSTVLSGKADMRDARWDMACDFLGWAYDSIEEEARIPSAAEKHEAPEPATPQPAAGNTPSPEKTHTEPNNAKGDITMSENTAASDTCTTINLNGEEARLCASCIKANILDTIKTTNPAVIPFEHLQQLFLLHARLQEVAAC